MWSHHQWPTSEPFSVFVLQWGLQYNFSKVLCCLKELDGLHVVDQESEWRFSTYTRMEASGREPRSYLPWTPRDPCRQGTKGMRISRSPKHDCNRWRDSLATLCPACHVLIRQFKNPQSIRILHQKHPFIWPIMVAYNVLPGRRPSRGARSGPKCRPAPLHAT